MIDESKAESLFKNKDIKLIALDLDGTTLTRNGLTRRTKETLEEAIRRGIHVVIATGRPYVALPQEVLEIKGLEYIAISNGGHVVDPECNFIYSNCASKDAMLEVREIMKETGYPVEVFTGGCAYVDQRLYDDLKENGSTYMGARYILRTRKPVEDIYDFWLQHSGEIENINTHYESLEVRASMWKRFEEIPGITVTSSQRNNIELVGETTSKANALRHLTQMLSLDMDQIVAFGDSLNDLDMLQAAGISVAMGNADEELKKRADFICPTNEEEGVCYTIRKYIFEKL